MAQFGSYGNQPSPTLFGYALFNKESTIDKTALTTSMWKTTIKLSIMPLIETSDDSIQYDKKNAATIYLTPVKAHMLAIMLREFVNDPDKIDGKGIPSNNKLITIHRATTFRDTVDPESVCVRILEVNKEGAIVSSNIYEFNRSTYGVIDEFKPETGEFKQDTTKFSNLEIEQLCTQLDEYHRAMTNAVAFTVADALYPTMTKLAEKLGVDLNSNYNSGFRNNSYFNNQAAPQQEAGGYQQSPNTAYNVNGLAGLMTGNE